MTTQIPLSLYIHIPWCVQKCPYCDFNSHAVKSPIPQLRYIQTLLADLQRDVTTFKLDSSISSIFIGGGTPSLFDPETIDSLLTGIRKIVRVEATAEITLEANPGTFESQKFAEFRALGINRLSIGIQSFNDQQLQKLGRIHDSKQGLAAVEMAIHAGFENFNLDLMYGLPEQTLAESVADIKTAIALNPPHLSFYQLTLESNTYFHRFPPKLPEDELIFASQRACQSLLAENGYQQYEVSAYSKAGMRCKHNLNYWQFGDYLGIGAGAHGKISVSLPDKIIRTVKNKHPELYLSMNPLKQTPVKVNELPLEFLMNHLRLKEGFSLADYEAKTGLNANTLEPVLSQVVAQKLLIKKQQHYYCSKTGWNFLDVILEKFV